MYDGKLFRFIQERCIITKCTRTILCHRFKMLKALGLNTVSTYIFWNFHEVALENGIFTGQRDITNILK